LQEILTKKFDSKVDYDTYQKPPTGGYYWWNGVQYWWSGFDGPASLGPGQVARDRIVPWPDVAPYKSIKGTDGNYYDDVDDYNGYERTANSQDIPGFHLQVKVYYVTKANPEVNANYQSYYKRIDVSVDHPVYLQRKITVSGLAAY
jgi:hypothetical protein